MTVALASLSQSLLFGVEVPETNQECRRGRPASAEEARELISALEGLSGQCCSVVWGYKLLEDVRALKRKGRAGSAPQLASSLQALGYHASVQRQEASSSLAAGVVQLRHEFVAVVMPGQSVPLIVEANFRELFEIAGASPRYRALLDAAPTEVVATYDHLARLVRLMCAEMKFSFEATGRSLPPWRSYTSVLSRWSAAAAVKVL